MESVINVHRRWARFVVPFALALLGLMAFSWWQARLRPAGLASPMEGYFASGLYRFGASTDRMVESLQARLRSVPGDWQAYSQLGLA